MLLGNEQSVEVPETSVNESEQSQSVGAEEIDNFVIVLTCQWASQ